MDENLLHQKLDRIVADVNEIKVTHAADMGEIRGTMRVNTQSLQDHMRRTAVAEDRIELIAADVKPISKHVAMVHGALKLIGIVATIVGIVAGLRALL